MAALSKPTVGVNTDYAARIGLLFDAWNNGNYQFPATQVPSADANTLDDYEEGTWTPSLGGSTTYTTQVGRYTKVGRLVHIEMQIIVNAIGTGSTGTITGLPFANNGTTAACLACGFFSSIATSYVFVTAFISPSTSSVVTAALAAAAAGVTQPAVIFQNSANLVLGGHYTV